MKTPVVFLVGCVLALTLGLATVHAQSASSASPLADPTASFPAGYFDEPKGLAYDEEVQDQKHEDGYKWTEFKFTSIMNQGVPIRFHAIYAVPDTADATHKVPLILMTHGVFGYSLNQPYLTAIAMYAKAGYAVVFLDWYPDWDKGFKPKTPSEPNRYTSYGKIDYFHPWTNYWPEGDDWHNTLPYQFTIAAERAISWASAKPEVDGTKVGATGASYGGIFSSMLAGIDPRISAANPCVYTSGFARRTGDYNQLPDWTDAQVDDWRIRFDSEVLLKKRNIPILYTLGSVDPTFQITKGMTIFAAMNEPKHLLIGPNRGHDYWDIAQGILFFDSALKGTMKRPVVKDLKVAKDGTQMKASVKVGDGIKKVEFYFAPAFELDPDRGAASLRAEGWKWNLVDGTVGADGRFEATWKLPIMRPIDPKERVVRWADSEDLDVTAAAPAAEPMQENARGLVRVFVRVIDEHGAMECTPLSEAMAFSDPFVKSAAGPGGLPSVVSGVLVTQKTEVTLDSNAPTGKPIATFNIGLSQKAVGTHGYVLWNWTAQSATDRNPSEVPAAKKRIDSPFVDAIKDDSFQGGKSWGSNLYGGQLLFNDHAPGGRSAPGTAFHGSITPGMGSAEEVSIPVLDDQTHRLTLVMAGPGYGDCMVRVSLVADDGATRTVAFRNKVGADAVIQFVFKGNVTLRVMTTSQSATPYNTIIGPSAMFLD